MLSKEVQQIEDDCFFLLCPVRRYQARYLRGRRHMRFHVTSPRRGLTTKDQKYSFKQYVNQWFSGTNGFLNFFTFHFLMSIMFVFNHIIIFFGASNDRQGFEFKIEDYGNIGSPAWRGNFNGCEPRRESTTNKIL